MPKISNKDALVLIAIIALFILASYLSFKYYDVFHDLIQLTGPTGIIVYFLLTVAAVVIAPVSTLPLLPLAVGIWGSLITAIVSIVGWTTGSMIAFGLSRWCCQTIIYKFVDIRKIQKMSKLIPETNFFWSVVFFRAVFPVDVLSYAIGFFTSMKPGPYFWATLIGVSPFAFIFAYAVKLPIIVQVAGGLIGITIVILGYNKFRNGAIELTTEKSHGHE